MSTRAIGAAIGVSKDTVARHIAGVASETPEPQPAPVATITTIKLKAERKLADLVDEGQAKGQIAKSGVDGGRPRKLPRSAGELFPPVEDEKPAPVPLAEIGVSPQRLH